jgi:hypothetical protein
MDVLGVFRERKVNWWQGIELFSVPCALHTGMTHKAKNYEICASRTEGGEGRAMIWSSPHYL